MKSFFKSLKKSYVLTAVFYVIVGICLTIWPGPMGRIVCYAFGGLLLIYGIVYIIHYFSDGNNRSFYDFGMVNGLIAAGIGIFFIVEADSVVGSLGFVLGLIIVIDSFIKFQKALELQKAKYSNWWVILIFSFLTIALGVVLIINPFKTAITLGRLIGIFLILDGLTDIWTISRISKVAKALEKAAKESEIVVVEE